MKDKFVLLIVSAGAFLVIYPVIFLLTGSFMYPSELQENLAPIVSPAAEGYADWSLLPLIPTIQSYVKVLLEEPQFFTVFWNSMKIVLGIMAGQALLGIPAAWGFARYEFRMKRILFFIYIILMMMPFQVIMLSEYLVLRNLSLLDSLWSIILPGAFSTFPVFVLYNFFRAIPEDIIESARLDGASELKIFVKIGIPLGKNGIVAALLLQFLEYWNVVEQPMIFLDSKELWPLTLYLPEIGMENAGQAIVAAVITLVPTMILFFMCKDQLEKGIVASAVKE